MYFKKSSVQVFTMSQVELVSMETEYTVKTLPLHVISTFVFKFKDIQVPNKSITIDNLY
jgi:hypothetical protein